MKKSLLFIMALFLLMPFGVKAQVAEDELPTGYCSISSKAINWASAWTHAVQDFTVEVNDEVVFSQGAPTSTFNNMTSTVINAAQGDEMVITFTNGHWANNVWMGFDWDRNGDFEDVVAAYPIETGRTEFGNDQGSITVKIPDDAMPGKSVMRLLSDGDNGTGTYTPETPMCGTHGNGVIGYCGIYYDLTLNVEEGNFSGVIYSVSATSADATMGTAEASATEINEGRTVTLTATPAYGYGFVNWTVEGVEVSTENPYKPIINANTEFVANFELLPVYSVSAKTSDVTKGSAVASLSEVPEGETVVLTATPQTGNAFVNWTVNGAVVSTENPYTATITADTEFTANFEESAITIGNEYRIKDIASGKYLNAANYVAHASGPIGGVNAIDFAESDDQIFIFETSGSNYKLKTKSGYYIYCQSWNVDAQLTGSELAFVENANGFYIMNGTKYFKIQYVDGVYYPFCDAPQSDAATFVLEPLTPVYTITLGVTPTNGGEATASIYAVEEGSTTTLTATPAEGYEFINWTLNGEEVSTEAVYTTTAVTENRNYVANFRFKPIDPREVKVATNDAAQGTVEIISPATEGTSVVTGEMVTVKAVPATSDNFFVNWTINGSVVGTENTYTYIGKEAATIQANFTTKYVVTINNTSGGKITVLSGDNTISSGDRVAAGTTIKVTVKEDNLKELKKLFVNGVDVYAQYKATKSYTTTVTEAITISAEYGTPTCILSWEYTGYGYVEVWTTDTYETEGADWAEPDGEQYSMFEEAPFDSNIAIFVFPGDKSLAEGAGELLSLTINGEEIDVTEDGDLMQYGDYYLEGITGPVHIVAEFDGVPSGVETTDVDDVNIYAVAGGVVVETSETANVEIYTIAGVLANAQAVSGTATVAMPQGVYIVKVADKVAKVIVK
ncbi:MAG: hypothetical protein IKU59_00555 [Bacteroidales bacterium]|nr:hypothetical protein [Bacteroidales bacterium]